MQVKAPIARKVPYPITVHDHTRIDHYFWLRQKENPDVVAYIEAENAHTEQTLAPLASLRESLFTEIMSHIKQTDNSVAYLRDGYYYYTRTHEGKSYKTYCRKKGNLDDPETVILDVNALAEGRKQFMASQVRVSPADILGYAVDLTGGRLNTIYFKNLQTNELLPDVIENVSEYCFGANAQTVYYTTYDDSLRPYRVYAHHLGTPIADDVLLYEDLDERFGVGIERSISKQYIYIVSGSKTTSETHYLPANITQPTPNDLKLFQARIQGLEYFVFDANQQFFVLTNHKAQNFRLMKTNAEATQIDHWTEYLAHRNDVLLENLLLLDKYMVLQERSEGLLHFRVLALDGSTDYQIPFRDPIYDIHIGENFDSHTNIFRYYYNSLTTPTSVYEIDLSTQKQTLLKQQEVPGGFDSANYVSERHWATATDGTKVPISLVYHKNFTISPNSPLLLYSYGSYGISTDPYFSTSILPLLDRGVVYAIAHIRGGQELGRHWYDNGKLLQKTNTFTDFIACADYLVEQGYTSHNRLVIRGGSAGGLLLGAVLNLRPDICKAACLLVPFVDALNTMLDDTLPLTVGEYEEWGNPNEKQYYDYILSYSPYDNIQAKDYPNVLVLTGFHDTNVSYWEPAKWVAKLREHKTDNNLLLLKTNMVAGHSGASGRYDAIREIAYEYAFVLAILGLNN